MARPMRKDLRRAGGASAASYALVLGLIAVAVLVAITASGRRVSDLFGLASNRLGGDRPAAVEEDPAAPPVTLLAVSPQSASGLDVANPTVLPGLSAPAVFTVRNDGGLASDPLAVSVSGDFVYSAGGEQCSGRVLARGQSCTISVQGRAYEAKSLSGALHVTGLDDVPLSGTASGFAPALVMADEGTPLTVDAACTPILVQNLGTAALSGLSFEAFSGDNSASFGSCDQVPNPCGTELAVQGGCNFGIRLLAPDEGSFAAIANVSASGGLSASRGVSATVAPSATCENGWLPFEGTSHCYLFSDNTASRQDAWKTCSGAGGYLASVTSSAENDFVKAHLHNGDTWIGLTRFGPNTGDFMWDSGETLSFTAWRGGEPNNGGEEFCGTYAGSGADLGWNDLYCDRGAYYVCERTERTANSTPQPTCPDGWYYTRATGHCYRRYDNAQVFADAAATCDSQGGYLASVTGDVENGYLVANRLFAQAWVGLKRSAPHASTWIWVSGEDSSYTRWSGGEPNDSGGGEEGEACVQYNNSSDGRWNDLSCYSSQPFVCEKPL